MKDKMDKWVDKAKTAIKWVAVNRDGCIFVYTYKPCCGLLSWIETTSVFLGETRDKELIKNWDKSLRKVKYGK